MLHVIIHRVLDLPAVSVSFEDEPALAQAFQRRFEPGRVPLAYVWADEWPHANGTVDLVELCERAFDLGAERMGGMGGWHGLV